MARRSAVLAGCGEIAASAFGLGRADLQCDRSASQSHPSVLDAAAARNSRTEGARYRRLFDAAVRGARAGRVVPTGDSQLHARLHTSIYSLSPDQMSASVFTSRLRAVTLRSTLRSLLDARGRPAVLKLLAGAGHEFP